ncbi:TetR/AcrR family transcriptional regulator [Paenibacillus harenae]|uniref:AcrR family transcriptional regulator n=1 Tax=Paenibacillus harenae TaxID=306543 RepID=A0ABT9TYK0_PAEHA|nr:TetR/AcrR family transcriptional regulator [Paenibacillus harenae]MDQ0111971.1 AcrR family transcriptional regulator [Paenibacillus harenae]
MEKNLYLKTLKLIGNKGIRFTTEDLAKELGTSKRTIYAYFASKHEIIEKTIDFVFSEIVASDNEIMERNELTLREKIILSFQNIPDAYSVSSIVRHLEDLQRHYPDLWEKTNNHLNTIWDPVMHLIEQGIKNEELEVIDTVILKLMLNETLKKLLDYDFLANHQVSFESGIKAMNNIILYGLIKKK